jgi:hypothetical protein
LQDIDQERENEGHAGGRQGYSDQGMILKHEHAESGCTAGAEGIDVSAAGHTVLRPVEHGRPAFGTECHRKTSFFVCIYSIAQEKSIVKSFSPQALGKNLPTEMVGRERVAQISEQAPSLP